jgi:ribosomal protein S18 acetylase RimI-like enzyme
VYLLRPPRSDDFDRLLALQTDAYRGWVEASGLEWDPARARRNLALAIAGGLEVIEVDGAIAGALVVAWQADPIELRDLEIAIEHRRRGLGTRIAHDVITRARASGRDVALQVLRANPARELWTRLGFRTTHETDTHTHMTGRADEESVGALERATAPWLDRGRRGRWARRVFADPIDAEIGFLRFVARRHGLPAVPRARALAPDDCDLLARLGVALGDVGALDLVVSWGGTFLEHTTHAERRAAAVHARELLRAGGIFVIDAPNMTWALRNEPDPVPRTIVHHHALVSRITDRTFDFHAGVAILRDTWIAEVEDKPTVEWIAERRLALVGLPEVRLAVEEAGLTEVETYTDLAATTPGPARSRRLLVVARAGG